MGGHVYAYSGLRAVRQAIGEVMLLFNVALEVPCLAMFFWLAIGIVPTIAPRAGDQVAFSSSGLCRRLSRDKSV